MLFFYIVFMPSKDSINCSKMYKKHVFFYGYCFYAEIRILYKVKDEKHLNAL